MSSVTGKLLNLKPVIQCVQRPPWAWRICCGRRDRRSERFWWFCFQWWFQVSNGAPKNCSCFKRKSLPRKTLQWRCLSCFSKITYFEMDFYILFTRPTQSSGLSFYQEFLMYVYTYTYTYVPNMRIHPFGMMNSTSQKTPLECRSWTHHADLGRKFSIRFCQMCRGLSMGHPLGSTSI